MIPRVLDATLCWLVVNLAPERAVASVCGKRRGGVTARGVLFAGEGLNKFTSLTRGVLGASERGASERLLLVAACAAASTLSRALTDGYVKPSTRLLDVAYATATELRRYLALATVVFIAHDGKSLTRVVEYFHCRDADDDDLATRGGGGGGAGGLMKLRRVSCVAPEWRVEELARQSVLLLIFAYLLHVYLGKVAKPTAFKAKPVKAAKVIAANKAKKVVVAKKTSRARAKLTGKEKTKTD